MSNLSQKTDVAARPRAGARAVLVIVCAGVVLASLDLFIVNVALARIAVDLKAPNLGDLSWILNGYAIVYASLLVFFGRLADRFRRDLGFLLGVLVFTLASAACAASSSVAMLVGFRLVQAAGAALMTPTSLGLVLAAYEPSRRAGAVRAWTAVGGASAAVGPVLGGLLVAVNWRWVFLVNVPIGIATLVIGWRRLPRLPGHAVERPDATGVILATAGVGLLTFAIVKASDWGWGSGRVIASLVVSIAAIAAFALHSRQSANPLIQPSLFRSANFTGASVVGLFFSAAFSAMLLSRVLWEQSVWGWSALTTGLSIAPGPVMVPLVAFLVTGRLIARCGAALVMAAGSIIFACGVAWWSLSIQTSPNYLSGALGGLILTGVGVGLTLPTIMSSAAASLPSTSFATGSAVVNMMRQIGLALGVAILVAVLGVAHGPLGELRAYQRGWWVTSAMALFAAVAALVLVRTSKRPAPSTQPDLANPIAAVLDS